MTLTDGPITLAKAGKNGDRKTHSNLSVLGFKRASTILEKSCMKKLTTIIEMDFNCSVHCILVR